MFSAALLLLTYVVAVKVFKKTSPNGKITVYLGHRDFGDHMSGKSDPVQGVVVVNDDYLRGRRVFGQVLTTFRYGREEDEIMGLHFSRQLYLALEQVFPPAKSSKGDPPLNKLQEKLLKKLGPQAHPFTFVLPANSPPSVTIQPGPEDVGAPLGVDYELVIFVADSEQEKPNKRNSVGLAVRKLSYACPSMDSFKQPSSTVSKGFLLSPGKLNLEVTLDKEMFFHGESVGIQVAISNYSKKSVKSIKVSIVQHTEVTLVNGHYSKTVASTESKEGCPVTPGAVYNKNFTLTPCASTNRDRRGVALDGMLKETDTNLASSTLVPMQDAIGIVISYVVRVRLFLGAMGGDMTADVPFKLCTHEPQENDLGASATGSGSQGSRTGSGMGRQKSADSRRDSAAPAHKKLNREMSTDLIFEDFARRRQQSEDLE